MIKNAEIDSESKNRSISRRMFAAIVISMSTILAIILVLPTMTSDSFAQASNTNNTATSQSSSGGQGTAAAGILNCEAIGSTIGGIVVPNPSKVCDVLIPRQAPTIVGPGNMNMNKFSTTNSVVEIASVSDLLIKSNATNGGRSVNRGPAPSVIPGPVASNASSQKVFAMGEFSLLDPQLVTMVKATGGSNWTIAAIHNHMVLEKPKMMFVHWSVEGDLNTIINQIKNVLLVVSKVPSSNG